MTGPRGDPLRSCWSRSRSRRLRHRRSACRRCAGSRATTRSPTCGGARIPSSGGRGGTIRCHVEGRCREDAEPPLQLVLQVFAYDEPGFLRTPSCDDGDSPSCSSSWPHVVAPVRAGRRPGATVTLLALAPRPRRDRERRAGGRHFRAVLLACVSAIGAALERGPLAWLAPGAMIGLAWLTKGNGHLAFLGLVSRGCDPRPAAALGAARLRGGAGFVAVAGVSALAERDRLQEPVPQLQRPRALARQLDRRVAHAPRSGMGSSRPRLVPPATFGLGAGLAWCEGSRPVDRHVSLHGGSWRNGGHAGTSEPTLPAAMPRIVAALSSSRWRRAVSSASSGGKPRRGAGRGPRRLLDAAGFRRRIAGCGGRGAALHAPSRRAVHSVRGLRADPGPEASARERVDGAAVGATRCCSPRSPSSCCGSRLAWPRTRAGLHRSRAVGRDIVMARGAPPRTASGTLPPAPACIQPGTIRSPIPTRAGSTSTISRPTDARRSARGEARIDRTPWDGAPAPVTKILVDMAAPGVDGYRDKMSGRPTNMGRSRSWAGGAASATATGRAGS